MNPRSTDCQADALTTTPSRLLQAFRWSRLHQQDWCSRPLLFSFPLRSSLCLCYSFLTSILPSVSHSVEKSGKNSLFSSPFLKSSYNGSPVTHFFREMTWPMSWPNKGHCSSHLQPHVVSLLLPLVSIFLLDSRRNVPSKFFDL